MHLNDRDLGALLVDVLVERDHAWLVRVDEIDEARHSRPLGVELPGLEPVGGDENERSGHGVSFLDRANVGFVSRWPNEIAPGKDFPSCSTLLAQSCPSRVTLSGLTPMDARFGRGIRAECVAKQHRGSRMSLFRHGYVSLASHFRV